MNCPASFDHLVVVASALEQGVAWCEATLGVTPGPGGEHPLMGTHNRLLRIASPAFELAYLEIIAIQPGASTQRQAGERRWYDLDDKALRQRVARDGPQLIHWVAGVRDAGAVAQALARQGLDRGRVLAASRMTPRGLLEWQITVRDDGQRLWHGCLPTLIQWGAAHPVQHMADSGLALQSLQITHPQAHDLNVALAVIGVPGVAARAGPPNLVATLATPRGPVTLASKGL